MNPPAPQHLLPPPKKWQRGEERCLNMNFDGATWIFLIIFLGSILSTEAFAFRAGEETPLGKKENLIPLGEL